MIQRIQTIYYLLGSLSLAASAWLDALVATNLQPSETMRVNAFEIIYKQQAPVVQNLSEKQIPITVLVFFSALMCFMAIFMYQNRKMQMRLGKTVATLCLGILVAYSLLAFMASAQFMHGKPFANYGFTPQLGFAFILLAFVFALLGNKAVKKDEDLVRSADRIR